MRMMQEAASAELVMLNSRAVLASSTAPFRSFSSFLSRTWRQKEEAERWRSEEAVEWMPAENGAVSLRKEEGRKKRGRCERPAGEGGQQGRGQWSSEDGEERQKSGEEAGPRPADRGGQETEANRGMVWR